MVPLPPPTPPLVDMSRLAPLIPVDTANYTVNINNLFLCCRGGAEMMMFLGGPGDKVKVANHTFAAVFYELDDDKEQKQHHSR